MPLEPPIVILEAKLQNFITCNKKIRPLLPLHVDLNLVPKKPEDDPLSRYKYENICHAILKSDLSSILNYISPYATSTTVYNFLCIQYSSPPNIIDMALQEGMQISMINIGVERYLGENQSLHSHISSAYPTHL